MLVQPLIQDFKAPTRQSPYAAAFDIYMPTDGLITQESTLIPLGFAAAIPAGLTGLLIPRSSAGAKHGIRLANTIGVIDADYRGEWKAALYVDPKHPDYAYQKHDRLLQILLVPVHKVHLSLVRELPESSRGSGGFGSTGT